jgi:hypothetical protein
MWMLCVYKAGDIAKHHHGPTIAHLQMVRTSVPKRPGLHLKACASGGPARAASHAAQPARDLKNLYQPALSLVWLMEGIWQWQGYDD